MVMLHLRATGFAPLTCPGGYGSARHVLHSLDVTTPLAGILCPPAGVAARAEPVFRPWRRIISGTDERANNARPEAEPSAEDDAHTSGARLPTKRKDAGGGTLTGSVPAGLSLKQLREAANSDKTDDSGSS